jgi:CDGSH-type Zn-finger protein
MAEPSITIRDNGPYVVTMPVEILDAQGNPLTITRERITLCRCGASSNKPFCDGTHKTINFESTVSA